MRKSCAVCGRASRAGRCPEHRARYSGGWPAVRAAALARDGHACTNCGEPCPHPRHWDVHHIVPVTVDPRRRLDPANCQTLCERCHQAVT